MEEPSRFTYYFQQQLPEVLCHGSTVIVSDATCTREGFFVKD